jgi:hypothetical protein
MILHWYQSCFDATARFARFFVTWFGKNLVRNFKNRDDGIELLLIVLIHYCISKDVAVVKYEKGYHSKY